jgi:D-sedoheptulose 7-phosphate isomerase
MMDVVERYLHEIETAIRAISRDDVRSVVDELYRAWEEERTIFIAGNGGSASTASHMMNDLTKFTAFPGRKRIRTIALTDNVPLMTAYANDQEYRDIFEEQLRSLMREGDLFVAISGSGNSPNIVRAVEYAMKAGARTIGLCGSPGGKLAAMANLRIVIPAHHIGQQEDGHLILNHAIAMALRERIGASVAGPTNI